MYLRILRNLHYCFVRKIVLEMSKVEVIHTYLYEQYSADW